MITNFAYTAKKNTPSLTKGEVWLFYKEKSKDEFVFRAAEDRSRAITLSYKELANLRLLTHLKRFKNAAELSKAILESKNVRVNLNNQKSKRLEINGVVADEWVDLKGIGRHVPIGVCEPVHPSFVKGFLYLASKDTHNLIADRWYENIDGNAFKLLNQDSAITLSLSEASTLTVAPHLKEYKSLSDYAKAFTHGGKVKCVASHNRAGLASGLVYNLSGIKEDTNHVIINFKSSNSLAHLEPLGEENRKFYSVYDETNDLYVKCGSREEAEGYILEIITKGTSLEAVLLEAVSVSTPRTAVSTSDLY